VIVQPSASGARSYPRSVDLAARRINLRNTQSDSQSSTPARILLVDDNADMLYRILGNSMMEVFGWVTALAAHASTPDLVLSDVMTAWNGWLTTAAADLKPRDSDFAVVCLEKVGS